MSTTDIQTNTEQYLTLLKVYTWYRFALVIILLAMYLLKTGSVIIGADYPLLFFYTIVGYLLFIVLALLLWLPRMRRIAGKQLLTHFFIDTLALALIIHSTGGVSTGLGMLMVITVAAASILMSGQVAILIAALCSIFVVADTSYLVLTGKLGSNNFLTTALLGVLFFSTSLVLQYLARRIRLAQQLAQQRADDISKLQQLNALIVQRMRTGILVVNPNNQIVMMNQAATELLEGGIVFRHGGESIRPSPPQVLIDALEQWRDDMHAPAPVLHHSVTGPEFLANFSALGQQSTGETLIFLEDNSVLSQRAQQLKLAALGRLTASIAHEIRNPLGAISHAAQLLKESDALPSHDLRLAEIIQNHCVRMNETIENVLQLSRRGVTNPSRFKLNTWLRQFVEEYQPSDGIENNIRLITDDCDPEVNVDASQLRQVLSNLVENALRYSKRATGNADATITVSMHPQTNLAVIDVIDDGEGVSIDNQQKIFEPFFTTETAGNGLGLYISRELCEANQARLNYLRTDDGKSCFRISFSHPNKRPSPIDID